jgi:hypothetical protein
MNEGSTLCQEGGREMARKLSVGLFFSWFLLTAFVTNAFGADVVDKAGWLLDDLSIAIENKDFRAVSSIIDDYTAEVTLDYTAEATLADVQQFNARCQFPLLLRVLCGVSTIKGIISEGEDCTSCCRIQLSNAVADLRSAWYDSKICVNDSSDTPDEEAREKWVKRQIAAEMIDCHTNFLDVRFCIETPKLIDWLLLRRNCKSICPKEPRH